MRVLSSFVALACIASTDASFRKASALKEPVKQVVGEAARMWREAHYMSNETKAKTFADTVAGAIKKGGAQYSTLPGVNAWVAANHMKTVLPATRFTPK